MLLRSRIHALDAVRGAAMLFVCLAHFTQVFFPAHRSATGELMLSLSRMASPTFVVLSGVLLGLLYHFKRASFARVQELFIDRALLLLTVGHLLIGAAFYSRFHSWEMAFGINFVTDLLAVCMIVGAVTIRGTTPLDRLITGVGIYALSVLLLDTWHPHSHDGQLLHDRLVGSIVPNSRSDGFPILPWLAVYYGSSALGEWMGRALEAGKRPRVERATLWLGMGALALGVVAKAVWWQLEGPTHADPHGLLAALMSAWQKQPPSPVYLLVFGGLGLSMAAMVFAIERRQWLAKVVGVASLLGRNSLFVFVLQFHLYFIVLQHFALPLRAAWPLWFAASLVVIVVACRAWDDHGGNRLLTVHYGQLRRAAEHYWAGVARAGLQTHGGPSRHLWLRDAAEDSPDESATTPESPRRAISARRRSG